MALNSKATLRADINSQFPTSHLNLITAADLRDITTDVVDSMVHLTGNMTIASGNGVASAGSTSGSTTRSASCWPPCSKAAAARTR